MCERVRREKEQKETRETQRERELHTSATVHLPPPPSSYKLRQPFYTLPIFTILILIIIIIRSCLLE